MARQVLSSIASRDLPFLLEQQAYPVDRCCGIHGVALFLGAVPQDYPMIQQGVCVAVLMGHEPAVGGAYQVRKP